MRLHVIQTGSVRLKTAWPEGKGHGLARNLHALLDPAWTDPLPIYAWVIEHPEGVIVIDTGETAQVSQPGYFPAWPPTFRLAVRETVTEAQEIGPQLRLLGIAPDDVRWVVLTHLHTDHAGGLHHFPRTHMMVTRVEYQQATGRSGKSRGYLPQHWPSWFAPTLIDFADQPIGPFPTSYPLTQAGDVILVPTPGHSVGHLSLFLREDNRTIAFAGDLSYTQDLMLRQKIDGVSLDERAAHQSLQRMLTYVQSTPTVYLPSHDPAATQRLTEREICPKSPTKE
ncbi:MAG: N-acyl homoserine lactonase family protein [Ktedonobacterales bacterium]|nr:N-acyl homoserine lactonase family protein [Ktedonobacteraceae bacterium]MBA3823561.1 N-acyl homoserine lactonase family protein [Ktedonobacterales bacterium]